MTPDECLAKAAEAEDMARVVSLATDKQRLRQLAEKWRQLALEAATRDRDAPRERTSRSSRAWFR